MVGVIDVITNSFSNFLTSGNINITLYFVIGMVIYAMFVFNFYRFLATRDLFKLDLMQYGSFKTPFFEKIFKFLLYILEHVLLLPVIVFFWFIVLTIMLTFLSETKDIGNILLVSMALVASVRVTSYYNEDLSKDLAKLLPFALLGIFLVDIGKFSYQESIVALSQLSSLWELGLSYLLFVIILEVVLRIFYVVVRLIKGQNVVLTSLGDTSIVKKD